LCARLRRINFDTIIPKILSGPSNSTKHEVRDDSKFLEVTRSLLIDSETKEIFGVIAATEDITEKKNIGALLIHWHRCRVSASSLRQ
jgi:hypothetical protein